MRTVVGGGLFVIPFCLFVCLLFVPGEDSIKDKKRTEL